MKEKASKPGCITLQQAIQAAEKEIGSFVDAESDPMLRAILHGRIDLSIDSMADSIEKNFLEGSVIKRSDGSIDSLQSTVTTDLMPWIRRALEKTKTNLSPPDDVNDPVRNQIIHANCIITLYSIRKEWDCWASKTQLIANEAIPLMNGLDPKSWEEYENKEKGFPYEMIHSIERCLIMAQAEGIVSKTPANWLEWGRTHDLDKPVLKSEEWLKAPDICMFYLFESAVNEILKLSSHRGSMEDNNCIDAKTRGVQHEPSDDEKFINIPGKQPKIAIRKLAVKAAWEIEHKTGKRATDTEVMKKLQDWADIKEYSETLRASNRDKRSVDWVTNKGVKKSYTIEACQATLKDWGKSRN